LSQGIFPQLEKLQEPITATTTNVASAMSCKTLIFFFIFDKFIRRLNICYYPVFKEDLE
jgi:hypothetical protein